MQVMIVQKCTSKVGIHAWSLGSRQTGGSSLNSVPEEWLSRRGSLASTHPLVLQKPPLWFGFWQPRHVEVLWYLFYWNDWISSKNSILFCFTFLCRDGQSGKITVDDYGARTGKSPGMMRQLNINGPLYVGKWPSRPNLDQVRAFFPTSSLLCRGIGQWNTWKSGSCPDTPFFHFLNFWLMAEGTGRDLLRCFVLWTDPTRKTMFFLFIEQEPAKYSSRNSL